jgi:phosphocarrier protein HPr
MARIERTVHIANRLGLHARAAASFVKVANRFRASITVAKDRANVNGKSIMGVLMLAAAMGSSITIIAEGADAEEAVQMLAQLVDDKFGED